MSTITETALKYPETTFYAVRSYGNDETLLSELELPTNIVALNPRGFNITDNDEVKSDQTKVIVYDTESAVVFSSSEPDFGPELEEYLNP